MVRIFDVPYCRVATTFAFYSGWNGHLVECMGHFYHLLDYLNQVTDISFDVRPAGEHEQNAGV